MFYRLFHFSFFIVIGTVICVSSAYGSSRLVVNSIKIQGVAYRNEKLIISHIPIVAGKYFSDEDIDDSINKLYSTGYFSNVKIDIIDSALVITVVENKIINQLVFSGNKTIKDAYLEQVIGIRSPSSYDKAVVDSGVNRIKELYSSIGYPNVSVDVQIYHISPGMINLGYFIKEGLRTKISTISFSGNNIYSSSRLSRVISMKTSGYFPFLVMGADIYKKDRLNDDEHLIRNFYYNRGYAGVKVTSKTILNNSIYDLIFNIDEGSIYRVGKIVIKSTLQYVSYDKLLSLISNKSGDLYSAEVIEESVARITNYLYSIGHPFIDVTSRINRNFLNNTVDIEYIVDQGNPVYIDRIDIRGNNSIYDYVIRRELGFSEGDPINQMMIEHAERRIKATGHFSDVKIKRSSTDVADHILLIVQVEQSGDTNINAGASCGSSVKCSVEGGFNDSNFWGRGYRLGLKFSLGFDNLMDLNLSFIDPYFLGSRVASGFNLVKSSFTDRFIRKDIFDLLLNARIPLLENISTSSKFSYNSLKYIEIPGLKHDNANISGINKELAAHDRFNSLSVSQSIEYNTLDDIMMPRNGFLARASYEYAGFGGDSDYHKLSKKMYYFRLLSDNYDIISSLRSETGYILPRHEKLQFFDQFMIDRGDLRGFGENGIGPRLKDGVAIGGSFYFSASAQVDFPMPFVSSDSGLRGMFFVDSATLHKNAFQLNNTSEKLDIDGDDLYLRVSTGVGISLHTSLLGTIIVYYGIPIIKQPYDVVQNFGFMIGNRIGK